MSSFNESVFGVFGEAIIDLLPTQKGNLKPNPGGSPYNVARALGKQGMPVSYLSPLSQDHLGDVLKNQLLTDGGVVDEDFRVSKPTSLAVVQLNDEGIPSYSLYREGIADREYDAQDILSKIPHSIRLLHTGSLAVIPEDISRVIEIIEALKSRDVLISIDFNFRPNIVQDHPAYVRGLESLVPCCDLLKASDEDLHMMGYTQSFDELAARFLTQMDSGMVVFTRGEKGAFLYSQKHQVEFEGFIVEQVVDTVGAGDSFQAGLLSALHQKYALDKAKMSNASPAGLAQLLHWACACAAINVTRQGCNPPNSEEIIAFLDAQDITV